MFSSQLWAQHPVLSLNEHARPFGEAKGCGHLTYDYDLTVSFSL